MFWKHPITKKNRFLSVVHATNGIPSYFDHDPSKTSTANSPSLGSTELAAPFPFSHIVVTIQSAENFSPL